MWTKDVMENDIKFKSEAYYCLKGSHFEKGIDQKEVIELLSQLYR